MSERADALRDAADYVQQSADGWWHRDGVVSLLRELADAEDVDCTCGHGGLHDPDNPRCARNQERLAETKCDGPGIVVYRYDGAQFGEHTIEEACTKCGKYH